MTNLSCLKLLELVPGPRPFLSYLNHYRRVMVLVLGCLTISSSGFGARIFTGLSSVEEGDDRQRPAVNLQLHWEKFGINSYYYGQDIGSIRERVWVSSASYMFSFMKSKTLKGSLGLSYFNKVLKVPTVDFEKGTDRVDDFGLAIGLYWSPFGEFWHLAWESHLYRAGRSTVLLTTARRQAISLSGGVVW